VREGLADGRFCAWHAPHILGFAGSQVNEDAPGADA
jgi:hypothetical protein